MNRRLLILLLLAVATLAVHSRALRNDFVAYDDPSYVTNNPHVRDGLDAADISWAFKSISRSNWHPLTWLSHIVDVELYGLNPAGHHATNVLLHLLNTLILFAWLAAASGREWTSAFVAGLFALHPLHVESVAWIAERKDVLSTLFGLLAMAAYVQFARRRRWRYYLLTIVLFVLSLMSKPMLVTLPFVLLLLDLWPLSRVAVVEPAHVPAGDGGGGRVERRPPVWLVVEKLPLLGVSAISCVLTWFAQSSGGAAEPGAAIPLAGRTANALVTYVVYIVQTAWPSRLVVFYPHPYLSDGRPWEVWQIAGAATLLVLISACVLLAWPRKYLLVGWLWYLGTLVPVIGLVQVGEQGRADRYTYFPLVGLFVIVGFGGVELLERIAARVTWARAVAMTASALTLVMLGAASWWQIGYWRDSLSLLRRADDVAPAYGTKVNLADEYLSRGDRATAVELFREALERRPDAAAANYALGRLYLDEGRLADAVEHLRRAAEERTATVDIHITLGEALERGGEIDRAIESYQRAVDKRPQLARARTRLGGALLASGRRERALEEFRAALASNPDMARAHLGLGKALMAGGEYEAAIEPLERAARLKPGLAETHEALARALAGAARMLVTLRSDPSRRDAMRALELAERAASLTSHLDAAVLDALAIAHAANGQFERAAEIARRAVELATLDGDEELSAAIRERLDRFERGGPADSSAPNSP
ncbi:MAG: tetratricopeptide repeat protein [Acidobacteriota bacterium]|nr:tetratricopeptide repeat protein [Acidobacteriota bacterium]